MTSVSPTPRPRVFVAEYCCGGGMIAQADDDLGAMLAPEGTAMWRALVDDLSAFCEVVTPIDSRLSLHGGDTGWELPAHVEPWAMTAAPNPWRQWIQAAKSCEYALVVIPESGGLLAMGIGMLRGAGVHVLAAGPETLRISSDKCLTAKFFKQEGIAHPPTFDRFNERAREELSAFDTFVVKPRDGCGATDVRFYGDLDVAAAAMNDGELIQSLVHGRAASVLAIASCDQSSLTILPGVWQTITTRVASPSATAMQYGGGWGPVDSESQRRIEALASRVFERLPGHVTGFVGIDLILGDDANHDCVIEINPRLTTSYVGMRQMVGENLTERLLRCIESPVQLSASCESIRWHIEPPANLRTLTTVR